MSDVLVEKRARSICAREHGRRHVYGVVVGGRLRDGGKPCDGCRLAAAAELATADEEPE